MIIGDNIISLKSRVSNNHQCKIKTTSDLKHRMFTTANLLLTRANSAPQILYSYPRVIFSDNAHAGRKQVHRGCSTQSNLLKNP